MLAFCRKRAQSASRLDPRFSHPRDSPGVLHSPSRPMRPLALLSPVRVHASPNSNWQQGGRPRWVLALESLMRIGFDAFASCVIAFVVITVACNFFDLLPTSWFRTSGSRSRELLWRIRRHPADSFPPRQTAKLPTSHSSWARYIIISEKWRRGSCWDFYLGDVVCQKKLRSVNSAWLSYLEMIATRTLHFTKDIFTVLGVHEPLCFDRHIYLASTNIPRRAWYLENMSRGPWGS